MKKSVLALILALRLIACAVAAFDTVGLFAGESGPVIALTKAPAYGDKSAFQGVVFRPDGGAFDPTAYRVSLYLQITEGGPYYVKPTYDTPYAVVREDGSFSIAYATGGADEQAQMIHIMLVPSSYTPGASYDETAQTALYYVKVTRAEGQNPVVEPDVPPPEPDPDKIAPPIPSGLPTERDKIAVDVGFYTNGASPGSALSADLIRQQLDAVSKFSDTVRFYGAAGELYKAYEIAHDMGFTVLGNAWLSKDKAANQIELDALVEHCNNGYCKIAIVGSEVLLRGDLTDAELVDAVEDVRERLTDKTIPVTTADSVDILIDTPSVRNACNLLMPNCYPYWDGSDIAEAAGYFAANMEALEAVSGGKEIVVSETGWPTAGPGKDKAKAGEAEAAQYYAAIREWSLATDTQVLFFDAADEPWKTRDEGESGAHWGFMTTDFALKDCYKNLNPFQEPYALEYVGSDAASATVSLANHAGASAEICYALSAYDAAGRMISCNITFQSVGVLENLPLTVAYEEAAAATQIKAFVLDADTFAPLRDAWSKDIG